MAHDIIMMCVLLGSQVAEPVETKPDPVTAADEQPIIVSGTRPNGEDEEATVIVGSRIARKPILAPGFIASNTPVAALSATSGVDPLSVENRIRKRKVTSCISDNPAIGKQAACLLIDAEAALLREEVSTGISIYRFLNSSTEFSPSERLAAAQKLFAVGQASADANLREEALIRMLSSGAMAADEAQHARRSLVTFALQREDIQLAIARLQEVVALDAGDAQSLANLAILLRQNNQAGASEYMLRAVSLKRERGDTIPNGWEQFLGD